MCVWGVSMRPARGRRGEIDLAYGPWPLLPGTCLRALVSELWQLQAFMRPGCSDQTEPQLEARCQASAQGVES